jgi:hypothetical protein
LATKDGVESVRTSPFQAGGRKRVPASEVSPTVLRRRLLIGEAVGVGI